MHTPLQLAAKKGNKDIVQLLLDYQANVSAQEETSLCLAAEEGHDDVIRLLLNSGANSNA